MLKLIWARHGPAGVIRHYQHLKLGMLQTVTLWSDTGADVIRIETEMVRERMRSRKAENNKRFRANVEAARAKVKARAHGGAA